MAQTFDLLARLKADVSDFQSKMGSASDFMNQFSGTTGDAMQSVGSAMAGVGTVMTAAVTAPIAAGVVASVKSFADFEQALVGVGKTTGLAGSDLEAFGKDIQMMARDIPLSTVELLELAETAGQLGVSTSNLEEFTRIAAEMGTATEMSANDAALAMARMANITGLPESEFRRLGSTVVELGNNMAASEEEIFNMSLRLAAAADQAGFTEDETLALSAALASVGVNAEAGGGALSRVLQDMNTQVLSSGEHLSEFARIAGMTSEEFAQAWQDRPAEALTAFVSGLKEVEAGGGDVTQTLKELGIVSTQGC